MSTKISQLTSATDVTANDLIQIVDVEDGVMAPSGTNKKATASLLAKELAKQPLEPGVVISGSSSSDAVRITQTGSGNALVVEDSTNPDATPFVVDNNGRVFSGHNSSQQTFGVTSRFQSCGQSNDAGYSTLRFSEDANSGLIGFSKSRSSTIGSHVIVQSGDEVGTIRFSGSDGGSFIQSASITGSIDGTPGTNDMPGRLVFSTTSDGASSPTERMRITSAGNVGIGTVTIESNCLLKLESTTKGFRPPSMTTTQRDAIATPIAGLMIYNNTTNKLNFYNGSAWEAVTSSV